MSDTKTNKRGKKFFIVVGVLALIVIVFVVPFKHKKKSGETVTSPIVPWYEIRKLEIPYWMEEPGNAPFIGEWDWPQEYRKEEVRVFGKTVSEHKYMILSEGRESEVDFDVPDFVMESLEA
ncbi:MAG: hypothetical protein IK020_11345 [Clostridiales bacterium]|nr:hypothetical protein [Clostridiales bacterium]